MRNKDENKSEAIFYATIQLLNEIGFSEISMSKIAKRANVSPATIYVYFENKEDLLRKLYLSVKKEMSLKLLHGINETTPTKVGFELMMRNLMDFSLNNKDYFLFLDQFSTSPLMNKLCLEDAASMFTPLFDFCEIGKNQKILKQVDSTFLLSYCYLPATQLAKAYFKGDLEVTEENLQEIIKMSWDAIRV